MIKKMRAFGAFWYDFIIGDDWRIAVGVALALGLTYGLAQNGVLVWWILPVVVAVLLTVSVWQVARRR